MSLYVIAKLKGADAFYTVRSVRMSFVTRVAIWFNSEGASPSEVIKKLLELGFTPVRGAYDFVYEHHEESAGMDEKALSNAIIEIANAIHDTLVGFNVLYSLTTQPKEKTQDSIPLEKIDAELESTRKEIQELEKEVEKGHSH